MPPSGGRHARPTTHYGETCHLDVRVPTVLGTAPLPDCAAVGDRTFLVSLCRAVSCRDDDHMNNSKVQQNLETLNHDLSVESWDLTTPWMRPSRRPPPCITTRPIRTTPQPDPPACPSPRSCRAPLGFRGRVAYAFPSTRTRSLFQLYRKDNPGRLRVRWGRERKCG